MRLMIQQGTLPEELLELRKDDVDLMSVKVFITADNIEHEVVRIEKMAQPDEPRCGADFQLRPNR